MGDWWYYSFKNRHPELVTKKSQAREENRIKAATKENLLGFYEKLTSLINEFKLEAYQIHNMDESNVDLNTSRKILAIKGTEYYEEVNKTEHITLITTITADGTMMKSVLIFQGQSVPVRVKSDESILLTASPSGWVDSSSKRVV